MKQEESIPKSEEKLGYAMVKAHLLSDNQLKTAFDYQRSLGGSIVDVVAKLGFVLPPVLAKYLADLGSPPDLPAGEPSQDVREPAPARAGAKLDPARTPPGNGLRKDASRPVEDPPPATSPPPPPPDRGEGASEPPAEAAPGSSDPVLEALIQLLIKKGVFRRRELEEILKVHA